MHVRPPNHHLSPSSPRWRQAARAPQWLSFWVALAVTLVFADSSIVVLALPQIVSRLHTSISHAVWVIAAYNLALIATAVGIMPFADRVRSRGTLVAGLTLFGLASLGSGAANSLEALLILRCVQGAGGGLLACASLPALAGFIRPGRSSLAGWAAAAALGAAIGPAIGGLLTEIFDWRAIFFAQAPVAAIAALAITTGDFHAAHRRAGAGEIALDESDTSRGGGGSRARIGPERTEPHPAVANLALACISAALIGALFLITTVLINVWQLTPLGAAAVVSTIPVATLLAERLLKGRSPVGLAAGGAIALAAGLAGLALISHRQLGWMLLALILCGTGLGMAFPALTASALRTPGKPVLRAARTVAARDAGLILGLLILTPVFVNQLNTAPRRAIPPITQAVLAAPIPIGLKLQIGAGLLAADARASQSQLPDINPTFAGAAARTTGTTRTGVAALKQRVQSLIQAAATQSFRRPLLYCALIALLALLALGLDRAGHGRASFALDGESLRRPE